MHTHTYSESLINVSLLCLSSSPHPSFLPFFCPPLSHSRSSSVEPSPVCDSPNSTFTAAHFQLPVQYLCCKVNGSMSVAQSVQSSGTFILVSPQLDLEVQFDKVENNFTNSTGSKHCCVETGSLSEKNKTRVWVKREKQTDPNMQQLHRAESERCNFPFSSPWKDSSPYWQSSELAPLDRYQHVLVLALPLLSFLEWNLEVTQQWRADPPLCPRPDCNNASCQSRWLMSSWLHHCPSNGPPGNSRSSKKKRASSWEKKNPVKEHEGECICVWE